MIFPSGTDGRRKRPTPFTRSEPPRITGSGMSNERMPLCLALKRGKPGFPPGRCAAKERLEGAVDAAQDGALRSDIELPEVPVFAANDGKGLHLVEGCDGLPRLSVAVNAFFERRRSIEQSAAGGMRPAGNASPR